MLPQMRRRLKCRLVGSAAGRSFRGTLRPYQQAGVQWLYLLTQLRLGACLADDMGLGKTIQVLSLLLVLKHETKVGHKPCLLVAPASLLANWVSEVARFAPSLKAIVVHPSAAPGENLKTDGADNLADLDLVITSYGYLARVPWLSSAAWRMMVLDEAQAIEESIGQADESRQAIAGRNAHCTHRNANREPARRPLVNLRLPQSWTVGIVEAFFGLRQTSRRMQIAPRRPASNKPIAIIGTGTRAAE